MGSHLTPVTAHFLYFCGLLLRVATCKQMAQLQTANYRKKVPAGTWGAPKSGPQSKNRCNKNANKNGGGRNKKRFFCTHRHGCPQGGCCSKTKNGIPKYAAALKQL